MTTLSDRVLTPVQIREFSVRSDRRGLVRLGIHLLLLVATGGLVAVSGPWLKLPAIVLFGIVQAALFAPAHETMHKTAFASKRLNLVVAWITACPSLLNAQFYASFHLAHHRHTQLPGDPERGAMPEPRTLYDYAIRVLGVSYWHFRLKMIANCWSGDLSGYPYISEASRQSIIWSVRAMSVLMFGGAAVTGLAFGWRIPLEYWIAPQLLGQPFLRAYLLAEHTGCTEDANGLTNTRTTLTNAAVRLLMWDMPFHAEHHLYPSIPFHRLGDAHQAIRARLGYLQDGYVKWHIALLRSFSRRSERAPVSS
jgi:fatty acid desaturase